MTFKSLTVNRMQKKGNEGYKKTTEVASEGYEGLSKHKTKTNF